MPPNRALVVGKVYLSINNCPEGDSFLPKRYLVVKVCGAYGWTFEFTVGSPDPTDLPITGNTKVGGNVLNPLLVYRSANVSCRWA